MRNSFIVTTDGEVRHYVLREWGKLSEARLEVGMLRRRPGANLFFSLKGMEKAKASELFSFTESEDKSIPNFLRVDGKLVYLICLFAPLADGTTIGFILYDPIRKELLNPIEGFPCHIV